MEKIIMNVLPANHSPLLRNHKIEKEKTSVETILSLKKKKLIK